ncbi:hypothetical protein L596_009959 [Steinernema carpocapsae]|uniref:Uncharacterized protein n=1 Tax=Steinernema carpocapsae TaxID=34508 RepID=A0A4V6A6R9_STECR|nr:hypothetical protein L596_009959 [Steinernema carpocapsae]
MTDIFGFELLCYFKSLRVDFQNLLLLLSLTQRYSQCLENKNVEITKTPLNIQETRTKITLSLKCLTLF